MPRLRRLEAGGATRNMGGPVVQPGCGRYRGTVAGVQRHRRRGEPACPDCATRAANKTRMLKADLSNWRFG